MSDRCLRDTSPKRLHRSERQGCNAHQAFTAGAERGAPTPTPTPNPDTAYVDEAIFFSLFAKVHLVRGRLELKNHNLGLGALRSKYEMVLSERSSPPVVQ
ncbi:hypothetical protein RR46_03022 [Papilio xuthus]|uniref:Uncharacterized protein n=1 Tax=Papilio xuthus TaxID=66420 RepID=A0A194Q5E8_PAPXU|nr:hypothetical protein RR46_03022 [Papilio xuthus]